VVAVGRAEPGERRPALQPLLGEQAQAAVAQGHEAVAAPQSGEEPRQADRLAGEFHLAVELEPVHPGGDVHREAARRPIKRPLRLDPPALVEQRAHRLRDAFGRDPQGGLAGGFVRAGAEPQRREGPLLRRSIAEEEAALGLLVHPTPPGAGAHLLPAVRGSRPGRAANRHPFAEAGGSRRRRGCGARVTSVQESDGGRSSRGRTGAAKRASRRSSRSTAGTRKGSGRSSRESQAAAPLRHHLAGAVGVLADREPELPGRAVIPGERRLLDCPGSWAVSAYAGPLSRELGCICLR